MKFTAEFFADAIVVTGQGFHRVFPRKGYRDRPQAFDAWKAEVVEAGAKVSEYCAD